MSVELVAVSGDLEGSSFTLTEGENRIGRSDVDVVLNEPLVSGLHARIHVSNAAIFLTDLDSVTGTFVNGSRLHPHKARRLKEGDQLKIGTTEYLIDRHSSKIVKRVLWLMAPAWVLVGMAFIALFVTSGESDPVLELREEVRTPVGPQSRLNVPVEFLRTNHLDVHRLALRRVTDFNEDEIDELWLHHGDTELVVTFGEGGAWRLLGSLPLNCRDRDVHKGAVELMCGGVYYQLMDGQYRAVAQDSIVVWLQGNVPGRWYDLDEVPTIEEGKEPPPSHVDSQAQLLHTGLPVPYRMKLNNPSSLAGFLVERGIRRPIHYFICDGLFKSLPAQALLETKKAQEFSIPCGDEFRFLGRRGQAFKGAKVVALAMTATGADALVSQLHHSLTGSAETSLLSSQEHAIAKSMERWPVELLRGIQLQANALPHVLRPASKEELLPTDLKIQNSDGTPVSKVLNITEAGVHKIAVGCGIYTVTTSSFRCATVRGCLPGATFLSVEEGGCGTTEKTSTGVGYSAGVSRVTLPHAKVAVNIETTSTPLVTDVLSASVTVQPHSVDTP